MILMKFKKSLLIGILGIIVIYAIILIAFDINIISEKIGDFDSQYLPIIIPLIPLTWGVLFLRWNLLLKNSDIDILINNAGITGPTDTLWEYDVEMWKKVVDINLMGTFNCCRAIVPNMIKNNYGRIVNVASVAGKDGNANASAYSVGKAGAIGLTKSLGKELAHKNIAVNAVTPAGAKTRILDQMTKEHVKRMLSKVPRGRFLEVEEFTSLVCWLSSQENTFSTAAVFDISGGRSTY